MNRSLLFIAGLLTALSVAAEPLVTIDPARTRTGIGQVVTVDISARGLPATEGGGVTLHYDPQVLQVERVVVNTASWNFVTDAGAVDNSGGVVSDVLVSSFPGVSGDVDIATVTLRAVGTGRTALRLEGSAKSPFASAGAVVPVVFRNATISVVKGKGRAKTLQRQQQ